MTKERYVKYQKIKTEIEPVKNFLLWSGKKYKDKHVSLYRFSLKRVGTKINLYMHRIFCGDRENTYTLPIELQDRIIEVIEKYVEEKELEMENI